MGSRIIFLKPDVPFKASTPVSRNNLAKSVTCSSSKSSNIIFYKHYSPITETSRISFQPVSLSGPSMCLSFMEYGFSLPNYNNSVGLPHYTKSKLIHKKEKYSRHSDQFCIVDPSFSWSVIWVIYNKLLENCWSQRI